jgi:hypothetical protein
VHRLDSSAEWFRDGGDVLRRGRNPTQEGLILSRFTGAAWELRDAVLVNPYDIERTADAIRYALEMDPEERSARMQRMRKTVKERNIYRWAGNLIGDLCEASRSWLVPKRGTGLRPRLPKRYGGKLPLRPKWECFLRRPRRWRPHLVGFGSSTFLRKLPSRITSTRKIIGGPYPAPGASNRRGNPVGWMRSPN